MALIRHQKLIFIIISSIINTIIIIISAKKTYIFFGLNWGSIFDSNVKMKTARVTYLLPM